MLRSRQSGEMNRALHLSTPVKSHQYDTPIISFQGTSVNKKQEAFNHTDDHHLSDQNLSLSATAIIGL